MRTLTPREKKKLLKLLSKLYPDVEITSVDIHYNEEVKDSEKARNVFIAFYRKLCKIIGEVK